MQFSIPTIVAFVASLASAAPSPQQGGAFVAVGNKYSGGGCTPQTLIFPDPIFGNGNVCQALDRSGDGAPIVSYLALSATSGCSSK
ncbi:hypothetical protein P154DRAFT_350258 [Amniculicola lignicola CBS 123094]|uniref:Uncharacterized protein n=1 Tax=Amniculicola lignicola CBS 123094 TaxID=1392246 RepID=A0A6A5W4Z3_9PLEO|nr:hypothetical protein P154DRAFT_350258 [Amniculicola lignicola CBS 123094]